MESLVVSSLHLYPVKSLGGFPVASALLTDRGFAYDRRWMLVDADGRFVTLRQHPSMTALATRILGGELEVIDRSSGDSIRFPLSGFAGETLKVDIWDDVCEAVPGPDEMHRWFSDRLNQPVRLVHMPDGTRRLVDPDYSIGADLTGFTDGYPLLLIGQSSLDDLNSRLPEPVGMDRFRPNIVFTGGRPYEEDGMRRFTVGGAVMHGVKPCARCSVTTIDPVTGTSGKEPLRTLSTYRTRGNKTYFGQNVIAAGEGMELHVGDEIIVLERASEPGGEPSGADG